MVDNLKEIIGLVLDQALASYVFSVLFIVFAVYPSSYLIMLCQYSNYVPLKALLRLYDSCLNS